jgi:hypothetical protein
VSFVERGERRTIASRHATDERRVGLALPFSIRPNGRSTDFVRAAIDVSAIERHAE